MIYYRSDYIRYFPCPLQLLGFIPSSCFLSYRCQVYLFLGSLNRKSLFNWNNFTKWPSTLDQWPTRPSTTPTSWRWSTPRSSWDRCSCNSMVKLDCLMEVNLREEFWPCLRCLFTSPSNQTFDNKNYDLMYGLNRIESSSSTRPRRACLRMRWTTIWD